MTAKQILNYHLFIQYFFISKGAFKSAAFYPGIDLYSQKVLELFGSGYKANVIAPLIELGLLRLVSDSYKVGEFCKKYALCAPAVQFYADLERKVRDPLVVGKDKVIKKRLNKHLQDAFDQSVMFAQYSIADARIHSSWCSVPSEQRHTFIQGNGKRLLLDLDLECAYPSMLAEYHRDSGFYRLFLGDFYSNVIREAQLTLTRDEVKKAFLAFLNSPADKRAEFRDELATLADYFNQAFPDIAAFIAEKNKGGEYLGGFLARQYEAPIMFDVQTLIKSDPILTPLSSVIIYDGIEIWGDRITPVQRQRISEVCSVVLGRYRCLRMKNKEINALAA